MKKSVDTLPKGVVVDPPMANALLFTAISEKLVDGDPIIGNGFVRRLMKQTPSNELLNRVFEQIIIGGKIFVPSWLPKNWNGELFERGLIVPLEHISEKNLIDAPQMSPELILGMLSARGINWSNDYLQKKYSEFLSAYQQWKKVADGKSFDGLEIRMALKDIMPIKEEEYTKKQLDAWKKAQSKYSDLKPVVNCIEDYRKVLTASMGIGALSSLPSQSTVADPLLLPEVEDHSERLTLFKITCKELRRVPIGSSLKETIEISESSEAKSLREKLNEWAKRLRNNDIDQVELVLNDITKARKALKSAKRLSVAGEYSTWLGIPIGVAGAFLAGPLVAGIGIGVSVVGGLTLAGQKYRRYVNRWAMFGQE